MTICRVCTAHSTYLIRMCNALGGSLKALFSLVSSVRNIQDHGASALYHASRLVCAALGLRSGAALPGGAPAGRAAALSLRAPALADARAPLGPGNLCVRS